MYKSSISRILPAGFSRSFRVSLRFAVSIITAAYRFLRYEEGTDESLAALIGDRSYLSGLPSDDPRNLTVPSMLPPGAEVSKEAR